MSLRLICQSGSKSRACGTNLLNILELLLPSSCHHHCLDGPKSQRSRLPKWQQKPWVPQSRWTFLSCSWTLELAPAAWPHVTILSHRSHHKAKASHVAAIGCCATAGGLHLEAKGLRQAPEEPQETLPQRLTRRSNFQVTDASASDCGIATVSQRQLGKETSSSMECEMWHHRSRACWEALQRSLETLVSQ